MISREQALWLYRCILNREPSEQTIAWSEENFVSFEAAQISLIMSAEFQNRWCPAPPYRPEPAPGRIVKHPGQSLAVAAIAKDEASRIGEMIRSALPVADHFVVVDTGSSDDTIEVARGLLDASGIPHVVESVAFVDFAQARNAALALVPDEAAWILMLDADEHLVPQDYQRLLDLLAGPFDGWRLPRYNFSDIDKRQMPSPYPDHQSRLFRNNPAEPVRYTGAVHEQPSGISEWRAAPTSDAQHNGPCGGPHIHHMGHVTTSPERQRAKHDLYNALMIRQGDPG